MSDRQIGRQTDRQTDKQIVRLSVFCLMCEIYVCCIYTKWQCNKKFLHSKITKLLCLACVSWCMCMDTDNWHWLGLISEQLKTRFRLSNILIYWVSAVFVFYLLYGSFLFFHFSLSPSLHSSLPPKWIPFQKYSQFFNIIIFLAMSVTFSDSVSVITSAQKRKYSPSIC